MFELNDNDFTEKLIFYRNIIESGNISEEKLIKLLDLLKLLKNNKFSDDGYDIWRIILLNPMYKIDRHQHVDISLGIYIIKNSIVYYLILVLKQCEKIQTKMVLSLLEILTICLRLCNEGCPFFDINTSVTIGTIISCFIVCNSTKLSFINVIKKQHALRMSGIGFIVSLCSYGCNISTKIFSEFSLETLCYWYKDLIRPSMKKNNANNVYLNDGSRSLFESLCLELLCLLLSVNAYQSADVIHQNTNFVEMCFGFLENSYQMIQFVLDIYIKNLNEFNDELYNNVDDTEVYSNDLMCQNNALLKLSSIIIVRCFCKIAVNISHKKHLLGDETNFLTLKNAFESIFEKTIAFNLKSVILRADNQRLKLLVSAVSDNGNGIILLNDFNGCTKNLFLKYPFFVEASLNHLFVLNDNLQSFTTMYEILHNMKLYEDIYPLIDIKDANPLVQITGCQRLNFDSNQRTGCYIDIENNLKLFSLFVQHVSDCIAYLSSEFRYIAVNIKQKQSVLVSFLSIIVKKLPPPLKLSNFILSKNRCIEEFWDLIVALIKLSCSTLEKTEICSYFDIFIEYFYALFVPSNNICVNTLKTVDYCNISYNQLESFVETLYNISLHSWIYLTSQKKFIESLKVIFILISSFDCTNLLLKFIFLLSRFNKDGYEHSNDTYSWQIIFTYYLHLMIKVVDISVCNHFCCNFLESILIEFDMESRDIKDDQVFFKLDKNIIIMKFIAWIVRYLDSVAKTASWWDFKLCLCSFIVDIFYFVFDKNNDIKDYLCRLIGNMYNSEQCSVVHTLSFQQIFWTIFLSNSKEAFKYSNNEPIFQLVTCYIRKKEFCEQIFENSICDTKFQLKCLWLSRMLPDMVSLIKIHIQSFKLNSYVNMMYEYMILDCYHNLYDTLFKCDIQCICPHITNVVLLNYLNRKKNTEQ